MKRALTILLLMLAAAFPAAAQAQDADPVTVTVTASSRYLFETQALAVNNTPVVNMNIDWQQSDNLTGTVWVQVGDENGREIGITESASFELSPDVNVHGTAGAYVYPDGFETIWTASAGVSVTVEGFTLDMEAQRYEGGFQSTKLTASVSHPVTIGLVDTNVTVGKAWNDGDIAGNNPWYARVSIPLGQGDRAPTLGLRGYTGAGNAAAVDISFRF